MARFQKGQKRSPKAGRKQGSPNRIPKAVKESVLEALNHTRGGSGAEFFLKLKTGSAESRRTFAHICARLIPHEVHAAVLPLVPVDPANMQEVARRYAFLLQTAVQRQSATVIELPRPAERVANGDA